MAKRQCLGAIYAKSYPMNLISRAISSFCNFTLCGHMHLRYPINILKPVSSINSPTIYDTSIDNLFVGVKLISNYSEWINLVTWRVDWLIYLKTLPLSLFFGAGGSLILQHDRRKSEIDWVFTLYRMRKTFIFHADLSANWTSVGMPGELDCISHGAQIIPREVTQQISQIGYFSNNSIVWLASSMNSIISHPSDW